MNSKKWFVNLCQCFVKLTGVLPAWLFLKPRVHLAHGASRRLPAPCILVSNHLKHMDLVLCMLAFPFRTIRFLIAEVMFNRSKLFSNFLFSIGGIRVERNTKDFGFVSHALQILDDGGTVGIFPQGRLPVNGCTFPFTVSTAFIATHTDAPIVPVYTDGNYGFFKRANLVIGEPIYLQKYCRNGLDEQAQLAHLTTVLEEKVYALKEELK